MKLGAESNSAASAESSLSIDCPARYAASRPAGTASESESSSESAINSIDTGSPRECRHDGFAGDEGAPEIALERLAKPAHVTHHKRIVEAELRPHPRDCRGRRVAAERLTSPGSRFSRAKVTKVTMSTRRRVPPLQLRDPEHSADHRLHDEAAGQSEQRLPCRDGPQPQGGQYFAQALGTRTGHRRRSMPRTDGAEHYVLLPAAVATGSTSLAARSGVSSFQRTDPNGRSSIRRTRTGSGPR